jgi:hypothetical protein
METTYKYPPLTGVLAKILWVNDQASGFYVVRLKGPNFLINQILKY